MSYVYYGQRALQLHLQYHATTGLDRDDMADADMMHCVAVL